MWAKFKSAKEKLGIGAGVRVRAAAKAGDTAELRDLLAKHGCAVANAASESAGETALHKAAAHGHLDIVRLLIGPRGLADCDARTRRHAWTPLHMAARNGHLAVVQVLVGEGGASVEAQADRKERYGWTAAHEAAARGHADVVAWLVEEGRLAVDTADRHGWTMLHVAASKGRMDVLQWLVDHGADRNAAARSGLTALHSAAKNGHLAAVGWLVEVAQVDVDARTSVKYGDGGMTALHHAAALGDKRIVRCLLETGASRSLANVHGMTAAQLARQEGHMDCARMINEYSGGSGGGGGGGGKGKNWSGVGAGGGGDAGQNGPGSGGSRDSGSGSGGWRGSDSDSNAFRHRHKQHGRKAASHQNLAVPRSSQKGRVVRSGGSSGVTGGRKANQAQLRGASGAGRGKVATSGGVDRPDSGKREEGAPHVRVTAVDSDSDSDADGSDSDSGGAADGYAGGNTSLSGSSDLYSAYSDIGSSRGSDGGGGGGGGQTMLAPTAPPMSTINFCAAAPPTASMDPSAPPMSTMSWMVCGDESSSGVDGDDNDPNDVEVPVGELRVHWIHERDVKVGELLGQGAFGSVFRAQWQGIPVALKQLSLQNAPPSERAEFLVEGRLLFSLRHPNIVSSMGLVCDVGDAGGAGVEEALVQGKGTIGMVMELVAGGTLFDLVHQRRVQLDRLRALSIIGDVANGMRYIHSRGIAHLDLKSLNVLLGAEDGAGLARVADFGMARVRELSTQTGTFRQAGTSNYMAPEVMLVDEDSPYDPKPADVYSFALIIFEIVTLQLPYNNYKNNVQLLRNVGLKAQRPSYDRAAAEARYGAGILDLMEQCWQQDPAARPTFKQVTKRLRTMVPT